MSVVRVGTNDVSILSIHGVSRDWFILVMLYNLAKTSFSASDCHIHTTELYITGISCTWILHFVKYAIIIFISTNWFVITHNDTLKKLP